MLFSWLFKRKKHQGFAFSDEDRARSAEMRRLNHEREKQRIQREMEMQDLRAERERLRLEAEIDRLMPEEDDELNPDTLLLQLFASKFNPTQGAVPVGASETLAPPIQTATGTVSLSDEQLRSMYQSMVPPHFKKIAKKMPDDALAGYIRNYLKTADDDTIRRAVNIVRAGA